jgi:Phosphotransferase enzyme family
MIKPADNLEVYAALEHVFRRSVREVRRSPLACNSSFTIEELEVTFNSRPTKVIFKNLSRNAIVSRAAGVKPEFLYAPLREINVYRHLHPLLNMGTAQLYGDVVEPGTGRYWLFLENIASPELYQFGDIEVWMEAAMWLARFHASHASDPESARSVVPQLLEHDVSYYQTWLRRAFSFRGGALGPVERCYNDAITYLLSLPRTLIHGEFYPSNILVQKRGTNTRICPIDWEMAAVASGILDVAALASGNWSRSQRLCMAKAWYDALPEKLRPPDLVTAFDCAQLQIAVQWLGWSDQWRPPREHAHDWLDEAERICSRESLRHFNIGAGCLATL